MSGEKRGIRESPAVQANGDQKVGRHHGESPTFFDFFSLALDESCDVHDTAQLLVYLRGIAQDFKITEELAAVRSVKGTTTGSDLFNKVNA